MKYSNDQAMQQPKMPGSELKLLDVFIGKWITQGHTITSVNTPSVKINAIDIYEWAPGGFFILHTAYSQIGNLAAGGIEVIGYDSANKKYFTHYFDGQGNLVISDLTLQNDIWTWEGDWAGEGHRATVEFSEGGNIMVSHHYRSDDGVNWMPSMDVTLTKVGEVF